MYRSKTLPVATAFALWGAAVAAQSGTDAIIAKYQDMGFKFVEIKEGITQTKVEAIMPDGRKVEVIYDNRTGRILKQENERASASERARSGVQVDRDNRDFLDDDERDDEDDDEDDDENDESDESDESDDDEDDDSDESDESDDSNGSGGGSDDSDESDESDDED